MKKVLFFLYGTFLLLTLNYGQDVEIVRLFFLGGQSNMEGHGLNDELPDSLNSISDNVWIYHGFPIGDEDMRGGVGSWEKLKPGNGAGFVSDGKKNKYGKKFGPELSFGAKLAQLYPGEKIALVKYARGGSSIAAVAAREYGSWEIHYDDKEGINQFDHFLTTIKGAFAVSDIDGDGVEDDLIPSGILWMQGESDAVWSEEVSRDYYDNLRELMNLIRAALRDDSLPVVIGKISDSGLDNNGKTWNHGELVQYSQEQFVKNDKNAAIIRSTKDYGYYDPYHYDSNGYIDLGIKFAEAVYSLNEKKK